MLRTTQLSLSQVFEVEPDLSPFFSYFSTRITARIGDSLIIGQAVDRFVGAADYGFKCSPRFHHEQRGSFKI